MQLTSTQSSAISKVSEWFKNKTGPQVFRLFGYAGTGKTTLARHFAEGIKEVCYAAYTGKAALQMHKSGCLGAQTVHSLCYKLVQPDKEHIAKLEEKFYSTDDPKIWKELLEARRPHFVLNDDSPLTSAKLLILDECSMVDEEMGQDLLSFGCKILVLGDPMQLPPIKGTGFFTSDIPDVLLEEIHRQAADNPIIAMSMEVRRTGRIPPWNSGAARVSGATAITIDKLQQYSQIICGTNKTRHKANAKMRASYGFTSIYPEKGDRLIALRNYRKEGIFNGMFGEVQEVGELKGNFSLPLTIELETGKTQEMLPTLYPRFEEFRNPQAIKQVPWQIQQGLYDFDYGYAITVHKAQGSQFDDLLLIDDGMFSWEPSMRQRWLYTAITRASQTFTYVKVRTI